MIDAIFRLEPFQARRVPLIRIYAGTPGEPLPAFTAPREQPSPQRLPGMDLQLPMMDMPARMLPPWTPISTVCTVHRHKEIGAVFLVLEAGDCHADIVHRICR